MSNAKPVKSFAVSKSMSCWPDNHQGGHETFIESLNYTAMDGDNEYELDEEFYHGRFPPYG